MTERIDVGVLGATGAVGSHLVRMLQGHPWFNLAEIGASAESAGRSYVEIIPEVAEPFPEPVRSLRIKELTEDWDSTLLLSALPGAVAGPIEEELARRGHVIVSNASSHRMDPDVPLIIPEINPEHLSIVERQRARWPGALVTNPNCSVVGLTLALAPFHRAFGLAQVIVTTLQSLSGAGRRGLTAPEAVDNVIPYIPGEEEKLIREPQKILGTIAEDRVEPAAFMASAQAHRVPVTHGHLIAVSLAVATSATLEEVQSTLEEFVGAELETPLPSAPERPLELLDDEARPQPRLDRDRGAGMVVSVGRLRPCGVLDFKFTVLVHNLVRGAAGAALLNAELCHTCGVTSKAGAGLR